MVNVGKYTIHLYIWLVLNHHFVATLCLSFRMRKKSRKGQQPVVQRSGVTGGPRVQKYLAAEKLGKFVSSRSPAKKTQKASPLVFPKKQQKRRWMKGQKKGQRNNKHFMFSPFVFYLLKSLWAAFTCNLLRTTCASTWPKK